MMFGLNDHQTAVVVAAASKLPAEKVDTFLQRVAAQLHQYGRFSDADLADAIRRALVGLVHSAAR
jgi:hypothetical protein